MESKVPKATHLSNGKRHKDEREAALPPARKWQDERAHNKFPPATRREKRDWRVRGDLDLQHLALSIYITSLHKAAMDHSSQLVLALWRKAMGCHKVQAFHILPENSSALSLSHSKLMLAFEDNIFKISLSLHQPRGYFWIRCCPARYRLRNQSSFILRYYICSFFCQQQFEKSLFWVWKCWYVFSVNVLYDSLYCIYFIVNDFDGTQS